MTKLTKKETLNFLEEFTALIHEYNIHDLDLDIAIALSTLVAIPCDNFEICAIPPIYPIAKEQSVTSDIANAIAADSAAISAAIRYSKSLDDDLKNKGE